MNRPPLPINRARISRIAEGVVAHTLRKLPKNVGDAAQNCAINLVWSGDDVCEGSGDDLLGWFDGVSVKETDGTEFPPKIFLVLDRLWEFSERRPALFEQEVAVTLLHELGHYLGLDEDEIADRGLA
ncbi:MAG: metallopeptidase family protein [Verrucomicrobiaceae bacterium]|nr:metallopeptidase family protein [Verrucomicrobiaceae bacterium]